MSKGGRGRKGWRAGAGDSDLDLDLEADLKAHRTSGVEHNGVPDDSAYRPATGDSEWVRGRGVKWGIEGGG